jgi:hypothetical protein
MSLHVVYIGNFEPPFSTENDLLDTMRRMGVDVEPLQEHHVDRWRDLEGDLMARKGPDAIMWTRTKSLSEQISPMTRWHTIAQARLSGVPTIGVHRDRWGGLNRQDDLYGDTFFHVEFLFTADGHDPKRWKALGANHHWMPPAIAPRWCFDGQFESRFESEIAFVGGWDGYGHTEWKHRTELVTWLRDNYGDRVRFWPERGQPAVRGAELNDLYASVRVVVGDSCLVPDPTTGKPWTRYCSDRVFETIGRGGLLVHPTVKGVVSRRTDAILQHGSDLYAWDMGDWEGLGECIEHGLNDPEAETVKVTGTDFVREWHTYENRLGYIFSKVGLNP